MQGRWDELDRNLQHAVQLLAETGFADRDLADTLDLAHRLTVAAAEPARADALARAAAGQRARLATRP